MVILKGKKNCSGCHACFNICPVKAIEMQSDEEGFLYPAISLNKCIQCNQCENVCPVLHKPSTFSMDLVFGCFAENKEDRMSSSSGGVFAVLARKILTVGGIVCGAALNDNLEVEHIIVDNEKELKRIKGTKYVQSRIGDTFQKLKQQLNTGRKVLFSGTPCQVAGLKKYLGKEYENLLCVDLICHGVPSPEVWKRYLMELSGKNEVENVFFRKKQENNNITMMEYYFSNGEIKKEVYGESPYIKGFIQNLYVRPSCFECQFKGTKRCSDITIGDFWSIKEYHPDFSDDYGTSAVIIHSEKGKQWFEKCNGSMAIVKATTKEVACWNECLLQSTKHNSQREVFFEQWKDKSIAEVVLELSAKLQETKPQNEKKPLFSKLKCFVENKIR